MYLLLDQDYESFSIDLNKNGNLIIYSLDDDCKIMELSKHDMWYLHSVLEKLLNIG